jgi:predicted nucleic acid binding AN1-type Zn finger protein
MVITEMAGVVSVFPNLKRRLHTTHSWDFMGLLGEETMEIPGYSTKNQVDVIVGFIDTGQLSSISFNYYFTNKQNRPSIITFVRLPSFTTTLSVSKAVAAAAPKSYSRITNSFYYCLIT